MRASRLLQILLILQNRGRMTSAGLARELEVTPRTILRDVDALTDAGLPIVVHAGYRGGIELGFEAEALGVLLARPLDDLAPIGLADAASRARRKLLESLPDGVRARAQEAAGRFRFVSAGVAAGPDPRLPALAAAVRERRIVRIQAYQPLERVIHPSALVCDATGWVVEDALVPGAPVPLAACGNINISAKTFHPAPPAAGRS
jgi:predicted DNA-binding transcriptional regulator YafY